MSPVAGDVIASRCVVVILGKRNPNVVDLSSKIDDASGVIEELLIPTCADKLLPAVMQIIKKRSLKNENLAADSERK